MVGNLFLSPSSLGTSTDSMRSTVFHAGVRWQEQQTSLSSRLSYRTLPFRKSSILSIWLRYLPCWFLSCFMTNSVCVHRNFIDVHFQQGTHRPALPYPTDSCQLHISLWFLVGTSNCVWHANKLHSKHKFCIFSLPQLAVFLKIYLVFLYVCKCFIWKRIHKIPWNRSFR